MSTTGTATGAVDGALRERARRVVPGGVHGQLSVNPLPYPHPQFFTRGKGARTWDVDGREYVDLMCSWGPILLGHRHETVDDAAIAAMRRGDLLTGPGPDMVELAERMVARVPHADWAMFAKNGTDVTTLAVTVARAATGHRKVLVARSAYHGVAAWSQPPASVGLTPEDTSNTIFFDYNDLGSLEAAVAPVSADVAAVVVTPIRHELFNDLEAAGPDFARGVRGLCDRTGAALVVDEIRCGLRYDPRGGWEALGVRPDLSAWGKSLANGHPLSMLLGAESLRDAAKSVLSVGSFWMQGGPIAAALATLEVYDQTDALATMVRAGQRLRDGLAAQAAAHGLDVYLTGPPQIPFLRFADDLEWARSFTWAAECTRRGVIVHPVHNWYVSSAHDDLAIDQALAATDMAFAAVHRTHGVH